MAILIKNCTVLPMTGAVLRPMLHAAVGVDGGRILMVSDRADDWDGFVQRYGDGLEMIDGADRLVMPGLINLHNHVSMTLMRSYADDMSLMPWLSEKIWPFEANLRPDDIYWAARLGMNEMLLGGTTTFVDMYWHADRVADAALECGMRAYVTPAFVQNVYEGYIDRLTALVGQYDGACDGLVRIGVAPHALYTCTADQIRSVLPLCERFNTLVHIHVSETRDEVKQIRAQYGVTPVGVLQQLGVLDRRALAIHCVHLTDGDIDLLARANVTAVHNPQSNMKLGSGISPVTKMISRGVRVGIGTDGPSSNNDLDMWEELRTASLLQKVSTGDPCVLPAADVLRMATINGAAALGMEGELGIVAVGARADLQVLRLDSDHFCPDNDLVANLVYCAKAADVETVIVGGRVCVRGGRLVLNDGAKVLGEVRNRLAELLEMQRRKS